MLALPWGWNALAQSPRNISEWGVGAIRCPTLPMSQLGGLHSFQKEVRQLQRALGDVVLAGSSLAIMDEAYGL